MKPRLSTCVATAICFLASGVGKADSDDPKKPPAEGSPTQKARKTVERGLVFLQADAAKWRKERKCATCHHGTLTVWALTEAKSHGYAVDAETLTDLTKWTKERLKDIDKPRDTRVGWNMVNTPAVYLALMALATPKQDVLTADDRNRIAGHLLRHQESNGSWAWSIAPAKNRAPPFFESDEVVTLLAHLALGTHDPADPNEKPAVRNSQENAATWLGKNKEGTGTQAMALRLLRAVRSSSPLKEREAQIASLLSRQNKDGGWGQDRIFSAMPTPPGKPCIFFA